MYKRQTYGRVAVASVAAVLALSMWKAGTLGQITRLGSELSTTLPPAQSQDAEPEPQKPEPLGKPVETRADRESAGKLPGPLQKLLDGVTNSPRTPPNT